MQSRHEDARPPPDTTRERMLWRVWEDVRHGASYFHQRKVPLPVNRLGQFVHGLCLPYHLGRALFEDREAWRRYLRVCGFQALTILAVAVLFTGSGKEVVESAEQAQEQEEEARHEKAEARELEKLERTLVLATRATQGDAASAERMRAKVEEARRMILKARELRRAEKQASRQEQHGVRRMVYWAGLFSALQVAQWVVIALSRDYHTAFGRELSLRVGLVPEDEPLTPRVRLNMPWLREKLKRRWRGLFIFSLGLPLLWAIRVLVPGGSMLFPVLLSAWGAWWFVVFTAAKSARAWTDPAAREPWFLRGWNWLGSRFALLRPYGSVWTTFTRPVFSPAATVERQPWVLSGLALVRALAMLPLVKCFLRPLVPVAALYLLAQEAAMGQGDASPPGAASAPGAPPAPPLPPSAASPTTS